MALTRSFLKGLDIPEEKIDSIIEGHKETVDALKEQRDEYKEKAEKYEATKTELDDLKAKGDFEKKFNEEHAAFEKYKSEREASDTKSAKESAYKKLLADAKVGDKYIPAILKATDLSTIEIDKDGKIKDSDKLTEGIKAEWPEFITTTHQQGASTQTPPGNAGGTAMTKEEIMKIKDPAARQKAIAENLELFGF